MKLELWPDDLLPEAEDVHLHHISYEHFKPQAQAALRLIGRGVFFRWGGESYHAVHPPKDALTSEAEALHAELEQVKATAKAFQDSLLEPEFNTLTLRENVSQALIVGGHWHGGSNEQICNTIIHLCKAANERDELRGKLDELALVGRWALNIIWVQNVIAKQQGDEQYEALTQKIHNRLKAAIAATERKEGE